MKRLPARIVVRTRIDWTKMDARTFAEQADATRPVFFIRVAAKNSTVETFADVFNYDFFRFRADMQAIALDNLRRIADVRLTLGFEDFDEWFEDPEDEVLFPTDDDDVFHPNLAFLTEHMDSETDVLIWHYGAFGHAATARYPSVHTHVRRVLFSNNWAVKKSFLRKHFGRAASRLFLSDHARAQRTLLRCFGISDDPRPRDIAESSKELLVDSVRYIDGHFSLQFFHPASLTQAFFGVQLPTPLRERYAELILDAPAELPPSLSWAQPPVDRYQELTARLGAARGPAPARAASARADGDP